MAVVTELQAELLAALLNSGVSSDTIVQALKVGEKPSKAPSHSNDTGSPAKLVNGGRADVEISPIYMNTPSDAAVIGSTEQHDSLPESPLSELGTNQQSIAEQLMRSDPWHSAKIIKQYMQQHNIPQREAVETTGLNQSHLSQHLNKGTPMKTQKRMTLYKWFEAKQREVAAQYNSTSGKRLSDHDLSSPHYGNSSYKRPRRNRFKWGQASTEILYQAYETQRNPSKDEREALVQGCNRAECEQRGIPLEQVNNLGPNLVTESRVYNWFANRRKEEAFKVKLAMDAGTYSVAVVAPPGSTDMITTSDSKLTPSNDKLPIPISTRSLLPMLVTPNRPGEGDTSSPRTSLPVPRLPTMSMIKCEQSPTSTPLQIPPVSQLTPSPQNPSTVLQRPISVAFGNMPPQILTPTQLQVITGLIPGQVVPISSANVSQAPNDVGTIPPGQVTNLMLPGQLGAQPIPMQAVTLMSMAGGTSQVFYSVPGQSVPLSLANSTTQLSGSSTVSTPVQIIPQGVVTTPPSAQTNISSLPQNLLAPQRDALHPQQLPQITSVQGASGQIGNPMVNMVISSTSGASHGQPLPSTSSRSDTTRLPPMQFSQIGSPLSTSVQQAVASKESKQPASEAALVRHMKQEDTRERQELPVTNGDKSVTNNSFADQGVLTSDNGGNDATVTSVESGT